MSKCNCKPTWRHNFIVHDLSSRLESILELIEEYHNAPNPSGDWTPVENPDLSKGEYGYKDEQADLIRQITEKLQDLYMGAKHE